MGAIHKGTELARHAFYDCARRDLGVKGEAVPTPIWPPKWIEELGRRKVTGVRWGGWQRPIWSGAGAAVMGYAACRAGRAAALATI